MPHRELAIMVNTIASFLLELDGCFGFCKDCSVTSVKSGVVFNVLPTDSDYVFGALKYVLRLTSSFVSVPLASLWL